MSERIYGVATKAWQIVAGCDERMPCAEKCWAKGTVNRLAHSPNEKIRTFHSGLVRSVETAVGVSDGQPVYADELRWTGTVRLNESHLTDPLRWRKPAVIATGYHGDLFRLPADQIDRAFAVMALCPQHVFLTLTKCAREMEEYLSDRSLFSRLVGVQNGPATDGRSYNLVSQARINRTAPTRLRLPLPNLYLGFSASNQSEFDARWKHMAKLAAAGWKTWVSLEPLTGPVDVSRALNAPHDEVQVGEEEWVCRDNCPCKGTGKMPRLSGVVLGGESGKDARPMHPYWVQKVRDECAAANVPFHFKQWGEYGPLTIDSRHGGAYKTDLWVHPDGSTVTPKEYHHSVRDYAWPMQRMGKALAGRTLDGRTHDELAWEVANG